MAKKLHWFAVSAMAVVLAACGGGDDNNTGATATTDTSTTANTGGTGGTGTTGGGTNTATASAVDKYVGTWSHCVQDGTTFLLDRMTITKTGDTTASLTYSGTWYAQAGCTGTVTDRDGGTGTATIRGQKTVGGQSVDMVEYVEVGIQNPFREILTVKADGRLYTGVERADSDTCRPTATDDCYPTALSNEGFVKQ